MTAKGAPLTPVASRGADGPAVNATVVVLSHNSRPFLAACLDGLRCQVGTDFEVLVVDNASTDGSADLVAELYPEVRLVTSPVNSGYAAGINLGFSSARGEVLAVLGPDCVPEPGWLAALAAACHDDAVGLATSMVRLHDDPERINTCGNDIHVLGLGFCHGFGDAWSLHVDPLEVAAISGCSFAITRDLLDQIGGFDESFFMYCEDTDLSLRAWLAGRRIVYVPGSVAHHRYRMEVSAQKFFQLEKNRPLVLVKNLRGRTLAALMPALALGELMMWLYALLHGRGFLAAKWRAWSWLVRQRAAIGHSRAVVAGLRVRGDRELLGLLTPQLSERQVLGDGRLLRALGALANAVFRANLALARRIAR